MIITVITVNGSTYELDEDARTWERTEASEQSGMLRTDGGTFWSYTVTEGGPLIITGPPVNPEADMRQITTSDVQSVTRRENDEKTGPDS